MKTISRYIMTLVLLITAATGAWAEDPNAVTAAEINSDVYSGWTSIDGKLFKASELPGFQAVTEDQAKSWTGVPSTGTVILYYEFVADGNVKVVRFEDGVYDSSYEENELRCYDIYEDIAYNYTKYFYTTGPAPAEPAVEVTTDAAEEGATFTEATFAMPAFDATADYELVRDMQDEANPVAFSGLPSSGNLVVKKGDDGKYQPIEALTIQLIDPLAAAEAQNIIAADGITVKVLVGAENGQGAIDFNDDETTITLEAFLADMKPGYYWIKAEPTDENSPYDGTVYSSQFTVVEQYDLTVKPANDFSKNGLDAVTVGSQSVTIDANTGKATKTGIAPDTEVKIKAKRGYVIDKVEVKKTSTPN